MKHEVIFLKASTFHTLKVFLVKGNIVSKLSYYVQNCDLIYFQTKVRQLIYSWRNKGQAWN